MTILNPSFEVAGLVQGSASNWAHNSDSGTQRLGLFNASGETLTSWDFAEGFETQWYAPNVVHQYPDTTLADGLATYSITDLDSLSTFITVLTLLFDVHLESYADVARTQLVHLSIDYNNSLSIPVHSTSLSTLTGLLNAFAATFNSHLSAIGIHYKFDNEAIITEAPLDDPTEGEAIARGILIKGRVIAHFRRTSSGAANEESSFILPVDAEEGLFNSAGDTYDSFEVGWSIYDIYTTEHQAFLVTVDDAAVSWPGGHFQYSNHLEYVGVEKGLRESFDIGWYLPGSSEVLPNDLFLARYYSEATDTWALTANLAEAASAETFESGWRNNEDSLPVLIERLKSCPGGQQTRSMATLAAGTFTPQAELAPPQASPYGYLTVTSALGGGTAPIGIKVTFKYVDATTSSVIFWADADDKAAGTVLESVTSSSPIEPTRSRTKIWAALTKNVLSITEMVVVYGTMSGAVTVNGWKYPAETFDENWTLTLE